MPVRMVDDEDFDVEGVVVDAAIGVEEALE